MEIAVTVYEKMKTNAKGNFTNPDLFTENGGHLNKKQRDLLEAFSNSGDTSPESSSFLERVKRIWADS